MKFINKNLGNLKSTKLFYQSKNQFNWHIAIIIFTVEDKFWIFKS